MVESEAKHFLQRSHGDRRGERGPAAAAELYRKEETLHVRAGECEAADFDGPEEACKLSIPRGMGGPGHAGRSFTRAMCAVAF